MPDRAESNLVAKVIKSAALVAVSTIAVLVAVATIMSALATAPS